MHNVYVFYIFFLYLHISWRKESTRKKKSQILEIDINEENNDVIIL